MERDPRHLWFELGLFLFKLGRFSDAADALKKSIELNPPGWDYAKELYEECLKKV